MLNATHVLGGQVRSRFLATAGRSFAIGALAIAVLLGRTVPAEAASIHSCTAELNPVLQEWNEAGFDMPSKPGQAIVQGRSGHVSSGAEVIEMTGQVRDAIEDCQRGDVAAAQQRVILLNEELR